jgi:hypothetical protein
MRSVLAVLTLGVALASVAPMAWASDNVDHQAFTSVDQPAQVAVEASDSAVAGPSAAPSLPYADLRQENYGR